MEDGAHTFSVVLFYDSREARSVSFESSAKRKDWGEKIIHFPPYHSRLPCVEFVIFVT